MNLLYLSILFLFCSWLWKKAGVGVFNKKILMAIGILLALWWVVWGQFAVADGWWFYNENNIVGFFVGGVPVVDILYFLAGIGWHIYFAKKLNIL